MPTAKKKPTRAKNVRPDREVLNAASVRAYRECEADDRAGRMIPHKVARTILLAN